MPRPRDPNSLASLARRLGKRPSSLARAIRDGMVGADDLERSATEWALDTALLPPRSKPTSTATDTRRRLDALRAEHKALAVQRLRASLIDRAGAERTFRGAVAILLDEVEKWPAASAARVAAELGVADVPAVERLLREGLVALVPLIVGTRDKVAASLGSPQAGEG